MQLVVIETAGETALTRLLDALGVLFKTSSLEESIDKRSLGVDKLALILSEAKLVEALILAHTRQTTVKDLFSNYACVLVYPIEGTESGLKALGKWLGGDVEIARAGEEDGHYSVEPLVISGPFAGLRFASENLGEKGLVIRHSSCPVERIASQGSLDVFVKISVADTDLFVVGSNVVFDVDAEVGKNLDASTCFSSLVPLLLFLRHCNVPRWQSTYHGANVVIDDPNLKPTYGFVNAEKLAQCVDEFGCAVSIGFIPWNFKRTSPKVVKLFRERWPRLSLAVHGCDHTGAEFSTDTISSAQQLVELGLSRMRRFTASTGLRYDRVMVFPQGKFSHAAMQSLRQSEMLAAVNTELTDHRTGRGVRASELLQPAITSYAGFPLFLRRPANEPMANFALDLLLGKPCLVVTHHDYFQQGMQPLVSLVQSLNALESNLTWTNLETIVSKTFSLRANPDSATDVRLFCATTELAGTSTEKTSSGRGHVPVAAELNSDESHDMEVRFTKAESLAGKSFQLSIDGEKLGCIKENGHLTFMGSYRKKRSTVVEVKVSPVDASPFVAQSLKYRAKVAGRRYLSEIRDNHFSRSAWASGALVAARKIAGQRRLTG